MVVVVVAVVVTFFSCARILGECSTINSPPALFFFFLVEISSRRLIPLFRPGSAHNGSASWDDCDRVFVTSCVWARFLINSHTLPGQRHSPLWLRWVKGVFVFRCNLPPALLAEWLGSFMCHCGNTRLERTPNKRWMDLYLRGGAKQTEVPAWRQSPAASPKSISHSRGENGLLLTRFDLALQHW